MCMSRKDVNEQELDSLEKKKKRLKMCIQEMMGMFMKRDWILNQRLDVNWLI